MVVNKNDLYALFCYLGGKYMYNNPYVSAYSPQVSIDRINSQIAELEKMKTQMSQTPQPPTSLTQNFQIAPTNRDVIKYAGSIDEVQRDMVLGDTPYFSKDMSVVWVKNTKGDIKTYELNEIIPKDEKDLQIELLMAQIEDLKGAINSEQYITNNDGSNDATSTTKSNETAGATIKESKSTSLSRISKSKAK